MKIAYADLPNQVGRELGTSRWFEVTQERINEFARVTGDHQWMHVDVERANRDMGGTISHGLLIACLLPTLGEELAQITGYRGGFSYGFDKLRFTHPVRPGQRVRLKQSLHAVADKNGGRLVTLRCVMEIEGVEQPALVADYQALYYGDRVSMYTAPSRTSTA